MTAEGEGCRNEQKERDIMFQTIHLRKLLVSLGVTLGAGFLAGILTRGQTGVYEQLSKPPLSPPGAIFGIVWTVLYLCMGIALYLVWERPASGERSVALRICAVQLFFNFCWPLLFFQLHWYCFAAVWLAVLVLLVLLTAILFYRQDAAAGKLFLPYLLWCLFALYLNVGVCMLN